MKRNLFFALIVITVFIFSGCGQKDKDASEKNKTEDTLLKTEQKEAVPVEVQTLKVKPFSFKTSVLARLVPSHQVKVLAKVNGDLKSVNFNLGDTVKKGQILATIDDELYQSLFLQAKSQYDLAKESLNRLKPLLEQELISKQEYETAQTQFQGAKAAYTVARLNLEYTKINSPIYGVITEKYIDNYNVLAQGVPVCDIANISSLKAIVGVSEFDIIDIKKGSKAKITVDSIPNRVFQGAVSSKGQEASSEDNTFPLEITVNNPNLVLKPGMVAKFEIDRKFVANAIFIPQDTVLEREEGKFVFKIVKDRAILQKVSLGELAGNEVQVLGGLEVDDKIVVKGQQNLTDGELVLVIF